MEKLLHNKSILRGAFYIYTGVLFYLTLSPVNEIRPSFFEISLFEGVDKIIHAFLFVVFAFLYLLAYNKNYRKAIVWVTIIGILIEVLQYLLPTGRSFDLFDWFFDILGGVIGCFFYFSFSKLKK